MRVLQLVDSLALGGLERVAVDLANLQSREGAGFLCASRQSGPLRTRLADDVDCLLLERSGRWDLAAVRRLARWIDDRQIDLIHAHGSSLLLANLAARRTRRGVAIVWHDHYGRWATHPRPVWLHRLLTRRVDGVIAVNEELRRWSVERLRLPESRCRYIANAVDCPAHPPARSQRAPEAPFLLACVANLRRQKDHETLFQALSLLRSRIDHRIRLQLIGGAPSAARREQLERCAEALGVIDVVEFLGVREDVATLLREADVGVLSSVSEGLPLALLEYGCAALPVVATAVGQVPEVVGDATLAQSKDTTSRRHQGGLLVQPGDAVGFSDALAQLLDDPQLRRDLGQALFRRVQDRHGLDAFHEQVNALYRDVLDHR